MIQYLIFGITFGFAAAVQPGPLQSYFFSQTLREGWRATLIAAFSPLISDGPIILLVLLILTNVPPIFVQVLQIIGGIFLLYLAFEAFNSYRQFKIEKPAQSNSKQNTLFKAALVNFLNPNPYLGWSLVMGPLLLKGWRQNPANGIILVLSFYSTIVICSIGIIMLFSTAANLGVKINRILIGISSAALACFGLYQLWSGLKIIL